MTFAKLVARRRRRTLLLRRLHSEERIQVTRCCWRGSPCGACLRTFRGECSSGRSQLICASAVGGPGFGSSLNISFKHLLLYANGLLGAVLRQLMVLKLKDLVRLSWLL